MSVNELLTDVPIGLGETVVVEYEIRLHGGPRLDNDIGYYAFRRIRDFFLWVRFDPDCLPVAVEEFEIPEGGEEVARPATLTGAACHRAGEELRTRHGRDPMVLVTVRQRLTAMPGAVGRV